MPPDKLSQHLVRYLRALKLNERNEVYETVLLMMLNDTFLKSLNDLIESNLKNTKQIKGKVRSEISSSKEYRAAIDSVCKSKYFLENFTKSEIERKKVIAKNIIVEIALQSIVYTFKKDIQISASFCEVTYPTIEHKVLNIGAVPKLQITFNEGTPLDDLVRYLKEVLEVKNTPKKKKMSLGQSFRMLQISNEIKYKTLDYTKQKHEYTEQVIAREMLNRYKEKVSMEAVAKSLQRVKKIKKEVNTFLDK